MAYLDFVSEVFLWDFSVFFLKNKKQNNALPITDPNMTRFNISLKGGVDMVIYALFNAWGGELYVPKIPSYRILDVAEAIGPNCKKPVIGIRPGEKIHEEMITVSDSFYTYDLGKYYVILPTSFLFDLEKYLKEFKATKVKEGFSYNSGNNEEWETVDSMRKHILKYVDPEFEI